MSNISQALGKSVDQLGVEASSQLAAFISLLDCRAAACSGSTHLDAVKRPCNGIDAVIDPRPAVGEELASVAVVELLQFIVPVSVLVGSGAERREGEGGSENKKVWPRW